MSHIYLDPGSLISNVLKVLYEPPFTIFRKGVGDFQGILHVYVDYHSFGINIPNAQCMVYLPIFG